MENQALTGRQASASPSVAGYRWWSLTVILLATFMAILDVFVVNVSIPDIKKGLSSTDGQVEWVVTSYTIAYAVLLVTGGRLGDYWGRIRMFLWGMTGFTIASALCGMAPSAELLIAARVLQGMSAAMMIPQVLSTIQVHFTGRERGIALGIYGGVIGLASVAGQIIGGFVLEWNIAGLGWRNVFFINIPFGIISIVGSMIVLKESHSDSPVVKLDIIGLSSITAGLLLLIYPLISGRESGWPWWTYASLALAALVISLGLAYERHVKKKGRVPFIQLSLFQYPAFTRGLLVTLAYYSGNAGLYFVLVLFLQQGLGLSPLASGLTFLPLGIGFAASSMLAQKLVKAFSEKVVYWGAILMLVSDLTLIGLLYESGEHVSKTLLYLLMLLVGAGQGIIAPPLLQTILFRIRQQDSGAASGILTTMTQISQALGIAILGGVFYTLADHHGYVTAFRDALWVLLALGTAVLIGLMNLIRLHK